ncbi:MAG: hypothetical protein F4Y80_00020 [Caldilineaceae bacterium SB0665_bin_21]|nr:hypothetical protein [Caldilineaceae bacterium SB0665_bin_21]MYA06122.1 hypothetical protein [Caldilineaceae bacterium SB0664_bin_22]MYC62857.1 hypothetical protein [Caldilineaceae bacterium SB0661_bin_34]
METSLDRHYIEARETLLNAVEVLGTHRDAALLVGSQAVYVHTARERTWRTVLDNPRLTVL